MGQGALSRQPDQRIALSVLSPYILQDLIDGLFVLRTRDPVCIALHSTSQLPRCGADLIPRGTLGGGGAIRIVQYSTVQWCITDPAVLFAVAESRNEHVFPVPCCRLLLVPGLGATLLDGVSYYSKYIQSTYYEQWSRL